ncbi:CDP-glycerol glycerophosphotransferase family protein [Vibrio sp. CK2-1]|uniref:CDP-glycerol glycerophosphotransferase family protein n=1 Tax=Vibrio sp. CK2-1 TaxID=2912249 RepID=UPI001F462784|nr:CDP-glycerol glycerophosphotransferase family protein [Vibrio sp. CK2-1]MCF7355405.1 CDP-glycerol glycerophosphotransferase family protein [Vibrio sp. CK2-1]
MRKFKVLIKQLLSKTGALDLYVKHFYIHLTVFLYKIKHANVIVSENQFIFECFRGKSATDSPYSLFRELQANHPGATFIWVFSDPEHPDVQKLSLDKNTQIVKRGTKEYFNAYASSQYWIVNCRLPYRLMPSKKQTVIQCWHGTPLKKLGLDIQVDNQPTSSLQAMHFAYKWEGKRCDYFLSPSPYASECFITSFGLTREQILEVGYPRNDDLVNYKNDKTYHDKIKEDLGVALDKKVILYAPTFRDDDFVAGKHVAMNKLDNENFKTSFGSEVQFLFRGHYFTQVDQPKDSFFINVSDYPRINDLLLIADELITDYSSLFFDYLVLNRPVYFYMYDKGKYLNNLRGTYLNVETEMPGPVTEDQDELIEILKNQTKPESQSDIFNKVYNPHEQGNSAQCVIQKFLGK